MQNNYTTVHRIPFEVSNPAVIERLHLLVNYDDAFVAYLNGTEIARSASAVLPFSSTANSNHEIGAYESFFLDNPADLLQQGTNIMAFVGLNVSLSSSDFRSVCGSRHSPAIRNLFPYTVKRMSSAPTAFG